MRIPVLALTLLFLLSPSGTAKTGSPESLREAAAFATTATAADGPALRALLVRWAEDEPDGVEPALLCVLDALWRLEVDPTAAELRPWVRREGLHLDLAAMLAVRLGDEELLLEIFDRAQGRRLGKGQTDMSCARWRLAGDTLAARRTPGFAARLLGGMYFSVGVVVRGEGEPAEYPGLEPWDYRSKRKVTIPEGYPVVPVHVVGRDGREVRKLPPGEHELELLPEGTGWHHHQIAWAEALAGGANSGLHPVANHVLGWESPERFVREATAARDAPVAAWWRLAKLLIERELLTPAEAREIGPVVSFGVSDAREETGGTFLPELPEPDLRCPFPLGEGPPYGAPPERFARAFAAAGRAIVWEGSRDDRREAEREWLDRFRAALGPLAPARFIPGEPTGEGRYGVEFPAAGAGTFELRLSFDRDRASIWLDGRQLPGYWSFRKERRRVLDALVELFPPERSGNARWAEIDEETWRTMTGATEVRVWCRRTGRSRPAPEGWGKRFLEALGRPGKGRYYLNWPEGLFECDYEVQFGPEAKGWHPEDVGLRLSLSSNLVSLRRLDLGHPGGWDFGARADAVLERIREIYPEEPPR